MENRISIRTVWLVFRAEYSRWITNPRIVIVGAFFLFVRSYLIPPLVQMADEMNGTISVFEPFAAMGNSQLLVLLIPLLFLVLISDYPHLDNSSRYEVHRCGKRSWICGQMLFLGMSILTYLASLLLVSCLLSGGEFRLVWSEAITKYLSVFPDRAASLGSMLLPSNLYNQLSLMEAAGYSLLTQAGYLFVLSLIVYLGKIYRRPAAGLILALLLIVAGMAVSFMELKWMWILPMAHTSLIFHFDPILRQEIFPVSGSYLYMGGLTALLMVWNLRASRKLQFL